MKKQFNPFLDVTCKYGAPMGRAGNNPANLEGLKRLHCRWQGGGGGYDKGGAYWGCPANVYGVWGKVGAEIQVTYVRAKCRQHAILQVFTGEIA